MLSVEDALELVAQQAMAPRPDRGPPQQVSLNEAAGLVLAEDVTSEVNSPPYDKSLMDGYAVRSADDQAIRQVLEEVAAGAVPRYAVTPGTATRVMTGAPLPDGADAVVPLEQTELLDPCTVRLQEVNPQTGQNVLPLGASFPAGEVVLRGGAMLRPIEIAILAEIGQGVVPVRPRPRLAVLPTGNEIVPVGQRPGPGQIRNSNGPMLLAAAADAGADVTDLGIARDTREELTSCIQAGFASDVLVLSGGVSAGAFDLVPGVLAELGVEQIFHKVALRPGKPLWFGVKRDGERQVMVFGLPGNPVSSLVCFALFVRPTLAALAGRGFVGLPTITAQLIHAYEHAGGRAAYLPACLKAATGEGAPSVAQTSPRSIVVPTSVGVTVEILPWHGSADLATLARANGLAHVSGERRRLAPGTQLEVMLI